jgi:hypothetical protein
VGQRVRVLGRQHLQVKTHCNAVPGAAVEGVSDEPKAAQHRHDERGVTGRLQRSLAGVTPPASASG